ncbi:hypothetical protein LQZ21_12300 [Treponema sp. TIM-1]|uniref:hypothetical protein n=1 Tax=Treponema sp. TIM-1 TaxID=2898417 RepID=UPI00397F7DA3
MALFSVLTLDLRNPLFYTAKAELDPFDYNPLDGEVLFCFELNRAQYRCFEPEEPYLGPLICKGAAAPQVPVGADWFQLPRGTYLFAQMRENLPREAWIAMAMDVQQEGLWRRLQPQSRLYLRYLQEDGRVVTQVWRAFTG